MPVFKDKSEKLVIPSIPIYNILTKFDGKTFADVMGSESRRKIELTNLPQYLIFTIKRFTKNKWFDEKNRTIVEFPLNGLDLLEFTGVDAQYDLQAIITHSGKVGFGHYEIMVRSTPDVDVWYNISGESLTVTRVLPE
jgi:U4/U6.U5 tri-snRNP-associated protein 2